MTTTQLQLLSRGAFALALFSLAFAISSAEAAHVEYGDFTGTTVMYLDVEEVANTPGDAAPLFGAPTVVGDTLDFDPSGFSATGATGQPDTTDAQLNFTLMAAPGASIETLSFDESGDRSLFGTGTAATQVAYALNLGSIVVTEVDGVALGSPVALGLASVFGTDDLSGGPISGGWDLSLDYDVDAALTAASVSYSFGATKLEIALNNTLFAASEAASSAFIAKKDFMIDVDTDPFIPEPTSFMLVALGMLAFGSTGSRRRS